MREVVFMRVLSGERSNTTENWKRKHVRNGVTDNS